MRYHFTPQDTSLPWSDAKVTIVAPLGMPMDALGEALRQLKWRLSDLQGLVMRATLASLEQRAERNGEPYDGPPSEITGMDEIHSNQLTVFASLRTAGFPVTWRQVCAMSITDFRAIADDEADHAMLAEHGADEPEGDDGDPQEASTDSGQAVDAAPEN